VRIVIFCPGYGSLGGIERIAETFVGEFGRHGHSVTVLARGLPATSEPTASPPVIRRKFHGLPRRLRPLARQVRFAAELLPARAALTRAVAECRAEVVLVLAVSTFAPYASALARVAPTVMSLQGREAGGVFTATPRALAGALRRASHVVACSASLAASARALAPEVGDRVTVIPNGVDAERFGPGPAFVHPRPYLLAVGRLARQKGFDTLLEAFARVASSRDVDLLIAGEGPERAVLADLRGRLGLSERVHFLGGLEPDGVAALYRGAVVVACPSRWEGLPLVCLEAMATGCAVVAAAVDGIPEAITPGETGLLVPSEDAEALTAALVELLDDPALRERLGRRAREVACTRFAWPGIARRYLDVLAVASNRRARVG
jgi:glycosyltransferase involved in cell wall biosynthesis